MAKMNQTLKEVLQIVAFFVIVGIIVMVAVIYPLNRSKAYMGRADIDDFDRDSLPVNDPTPLEEAGFAVDTFGVAVDGMTVVSAAVLSPLLDSARPAEPINPRGTAILIHDEREDRNSWIPLARTLVDSGFTVVVYDQRATGVSGGLYHGDGQYEAADLGEILSYMDIRGLLQRPSTVVGRALGAEAALLEARDETRIDNVVAISPYLSTKRMLDVLRREHDAYWIPFFRTLFWWWYEMRSSYAAPYRTIDNISGVGCRTLLLADAAALSEPEFVRLKELSQPDWLETAVLIDDPATLDQTIVHFMFSPDSTEAAAE